MIKLALRPPQINKRTDLVKFLYQNHIKVIIIATSMLIRKIIELKPVHNNKESNIYKKIMLGNKKYSNKDHKLHKIIINN